MELILWRHAEAEEPSAGMSDAQRPLTAKGKKQARKIAKWLEKRIEGKVRVIVSPAQRTRETADAHTKHAHVEASIGVGAPAKSVLTAIGWPDRAGTVIVVGHQPTLGRVAALLLTGKEADWDIKKGSVWWLTSRAAPDGAIEVTLRAVMAPNQA
jgi:phosphohistidine phosphatase